MITSLTGKKVRIGIKNGLTLVGFCEKYDCGVGEFRGRLERIFTQKEVFRQVWGEIQANEKKPRRTSAPMEVQIVTAVETSPEPALEEPQEKHSLSLDELKVLEASYSGEAIEFETRYKNLFQERLACRDAYKRIRDELEELKRQFQSKGCEAEKVIRHDEKIVTEMNEISEQYRVKRAALETVRREIEEKSKITVCVFANREIALLDDTAEITLDDKGHDELFKKLREQEIAEEFRPRDVRLVARILKIQANLNAPVEVLFDDEEIKLAYEAFVKID